MGNERFEVKVELQKFKEKNEPNLRKQKRTERQDGTKNEKK